MSAPPIGSRCLLVVSPYLPQSKPELVEVVSKPYNGDYKAQGQKVKIGTCVRVRMLEEHQCSPGCKAPKHEIGARLDQQREAPANG